MTTATIVEHDHAIANDIRPPCDATRALYPGEHECPRPAEWIMRVIGWRQTLGTFLVCDNHAQEAVKHSTTCPECSKTITVETERI